MEFGKLCSWEKQRNRVVFQFEKRTGRVEILTPEIFNVFSGVVSEEHRSKAIEGDKSVAVDFTAAEADGAVEISTDAVTARIYDDFKVDFYKADGTVLCRDYRGSRKICAGLSDELKALKEAEGHSVEEQRTEAVEVVKQLEGDEAFYGLGDKTGFMDKRGYEYVMWNTDDPAPQMDNFKSLYKSIPFFITLHKNAVFGLFYDNTYRSCFDMGIGGILLVWCCRRQSGLLSDRRREYAGGAWQLYLSDRYGSGSAEVDPGLSSVPLELYV